MVWILSLTAFGMFTSTIKLEGQKLPVLRSMSCVRQLLCQLNQNDIRVVPRAIEDNLLAVQ